MSKKTRFLLASLFLTFFLTLLPVGQNYSSYAVFAFALLGLVITLIMLWFDLKGLEFITLLTLPTLFCLSMAALLINFPNFSVFFKIIFYAVFFIFYYSLLLSLNVFNVVREKMIPLLRAAYTVSFLITVFSSLPIFTMVYKVFLSLTWELGLVFLVCFLLDFQSLWTVFLPTRNDRTVLKSSLALSLLMTETALVFSFFPLESFFRSLTLATFFYIYLSFTHQYLRKSLNIKSLVEYGLVGSFIVGLVVLY